MTSQYFTAALAPIRALPPSRLFPARADAPDIRVNLDHSAAAFVSHSEHELSYERDAWKRFRAGSGFQRSGYLVLNRNAKSSVA
jgi:hypothetical protein